MAPDGPRLPCQEFGLWPGVPLKSTESFFITTFCYDFYQAVPFGHWQLVLLHIFLRISSLLLFENVKKTGGNECEASGSLRGHVVGHAPHNMPSKYFLKKITSSKIEKFLVLIFAVKTVQIDLILSQGERETVFRPKKRF